MSSNVSPRITWCRLVLSFLSVWQLIREYDTSNFLMGSQMNKVCDDRLSGIMPEHAWGPRRVHFLYGDSGCFKLLQTTKTAKRLARRNNQIQDQTERKLTLSNTNNCCVAFVAVRILGCCVGQFERAEVEQKAGRGCEAWLKPPVQGSNSSRFEVPEVPKQGSNSFGGREKGSERCSSPKPL